MEKTRAELLAEIAAMDQGMQGPVTFIPTGSSGLIAGRFFYRKLGFRPPKKGEWYLSGAIVEAYQAPNDLTDSFTIVEKLRPARRISIEVPA